MVFNQKKGAPVADYTPANTQLKKVNETKYLGVILQSNLKFDKRILSKTRRARQQLGMIKRVLYDAPEKAKLLAYTALCGICIDLVGSIYETTAARTRHGAKWCYSIICKHKGRDSVTEALEKLGDRRKISVGVTSC